MKELEQILTGLSDLHGQMNGNQAACEQVVALQKLARNMMQSKDKETEEILEDYRDDAINQLSRFKELMETTSEPMPDSELFVLSSAAQMFSMAVQGYFNWRNIAGFQRLDASMIAPEV